MDEGSCQKGDIVGSKRSSKSKTRNGNVDNDTYFQFLLMKASRIPSLLQHK